MIDLGTVRPGSTIRIPFSSYDKDDGSSITMTNYSAADILIYKDGSTTERASTAGFTATTDFDGKTGKHLAVIDLADNTTADFYNAGSEYLVAIDSVTVDAVTTGGWIARFRIGYEDAIYSTTIATLASQTSFTLTAGPAEDSALLGCVVVIHDIASAVQHSYAVISAYTGSTKTVTLTGAATFTVAAGDNISVFAPGNARWFASLLTSALPLAPTTAGRTLDVSAGGEAGLDWANVGSPTTSLALTGTTIATTQKVDVETIKTNPVVNGGTVTYPTNATLASTTNIAAGTVTTATNVTTVNGLAAGVITAASIAADAITDAKIASDVTIASVTGSVGSIATGGISEASFASAAGSFYPLGIIDQGTSQAVSATTLQLRSAASFPNSQPIGATVLLTSGSNAGATAIIESYVSATDTATFTAWSGSVTPTGTPDYKVYGTATAAGGGSAPTAAQVADAVWDELLSGHAGAGSAGEALSAAGTAGDPWTTALPGAYGAGTAGKIIGDNLTGNAYTRLGAPAGASISADIAAVKAETASILTDTAEIGAAGVGLTALATQASVNTIDDFLDTEVAAIKAKTDSLTFTTAGMVDAAIKRVGDTTLSAAGTGGQGYGA